VRIPRLPLGNARWIALSGGVLVLSVIITVVVGTLGWFGFPASEAAAGRQTRATVISASPCDPPGAMETVRFTLDGQWHEARFDGCGHARDESVEVQVSPGNVVHAADAANGQGHYGRRLGALLLVLSGVAGAGFFLLVRRGPRGNGLPVLGPLTPVNLLRTRRSG
jgi:hypothetical protein